MTPRRYPNNLPIALSSFIGRGRELVEVKRLLLATRLLTLTGPGGCGKTRLALQAAAELGEQFTDGIWLAEFAALIAPELAPQSVIRALWVAQEGIGNPVDLLIQFLAERHLLLIFDNCEHLIEAATHLAATLLQRCPDLRILATSREAFLIAGETVWHVPPLSLPTPAPNTRISDLDAVSVLMQSEAARLFIERAVAATPDFMPTDHNAPAITEICRRLDGMPLAIELAAARTRILTVEQIADWLVHPEAHPPTRVQLLATQSRNGPRRHQSLQAALDWSYTLLTAAERTVLQSLTVFAGGCTLEAAEAVCAHEALPPAFLFEMMTRLIDKSLVNMHEQEGLARYNLLETIRQYAYDKLVEAGKEDAACRRHRVYFLALAEHAQTHFTGSAQLTWFQRIEVELDNLRVALERIVAGTGEEEGQVALGLRLGTALEIFWGSRGSPAEGVEWLRKLLAPPAANAPALALIRGRALNTLCILEVLVDSSMALVQARAEEAYALGQQIEDEQVMAAALRNLGICALRAENLAVAQEFLERSVTLWRHLSARSLGHAWHGLGWTRLYQAAITFHQGNYQEAEAYYLECVQIFRQVGDANFLALALRRLGNAKLRLGDVKQARTLFQESLQLNLVMNSHHGIVASLASIAATLAARGDGRAAARLFGATKTLLAKAPVALTLTDRLEWEHTQQAVQNLLDDKAFQATHMADQTLTLQQIVDYALAEGGGAAHIPFVLGNTELSKEQYGGLSPREREVAALLAQGKSNRAIAEELVVGVKTIETYVTRILNKLGLSSRLQIARWVDEKGLAAPAENKKALDN